MLRHLDKQIYNMISFPSLPTLFVVISCKEPTQALPPERYFAVPVAWCFFAVAPILVPLGREAGVESCFLRPLWPEANTTLVKRVFIC